MSWSVKDIPDQSGKIVLITGANSGLGYETLKVFCGKGAHVLMGCRSKFKAEKSREKILNKNDITGSIEIIKMDLSDLSEVKLAADYISRKYMKLDVLINNAGIMAPPRKLSEQGLEIQFAVNHLAHMFLTNRLLPLMSESFNSRVVTVTSAAQYIAKINWNDLQGCVKYDPWFSYAQSKLINVMFALQLQDQFNNRKIQVKSLLAHPGIAKTNLQSSSVWAGRSNNFKEALNELISPIFQDAQMGALSQIMASTLPNVRGGEQYGPRFNFRGRPKVCGIAPYALNEDARKRIWEVSEMLINRYIKD